MGMCISSLLKKGYIEVRMTDLSQSGRIFPYFQAVLCTIHCYTKSSHMQFGLF